jgi:hypothetical protein
MVFQIFLQLLSQVTCSENDTHYSSFGGTAQEGLKVGEYHFGGNERTDHFHIAVQVM